jgi:hypothetical protein
MSAPVARDRCDLAGLDCGWLAIDRHGHVAVFYTGGEGPIHDDADPYDEAAEQALQRMTATSPFELLVTYSRPDDYVEAARCGLYAYDWSDVHRFAGDAIEGYELIARPDRPIHWTQLPEPLRTFASAARLPVEFGQPVLSRFAIID